MYSQGWEHLFQRCHSFINALHCQYPPSLSPRPGHLPFYQVARWCWSCWFSALWSVYILFKTALGISTLQMPQHPEEAEIFSGSGNCFLCRKGQPHYQRWWDLTGTWGSITMTSFCRGRCNSSMEGEGVEEAKYFNLHWPAWQAWNKNFSC